MLTRSQTNNPVIQGHVYYLSFSLIFATADCVFGFQKFASRHFWNLIVYILVTYATALYTVLASTHTKLHSSLHILLAVRVLKEEDIYSINSCFYCFFVKKKCFIYLCYPSKILNIITNPMPIIFHFFPLFHAFSLKQMWIAAPDSSLMYETFFRKHFINVRFSSIHS